MKYFMQSKIVILVLFTAIVLNLTPIFSEEVSMTSEEAESIQEEIRWLQAEAVITIATKREISLSKAPGITTVITASQIKQMGFRTLVDALKTVPGFDISMDETGEREIAVRGILDNNSQKVRVMIDGHSINDPWRGGATWNFDDLVVENAKRIEIIRGPGSALYGQNAFLAVINVITKDTEDIDGFQWTISGGEFDTQNYNMLFGKELGDLKISGFFDYFDTNGFTETIEQDIIFGNPGSLSPGRPNNEKEKTDLNLKLSYKNLTFHSKYMKKRRRDYIGVGNALNKDTMLKDTYIFSELIYNLSLGDKLDMITKAYYDQYNFDPFFEQRPDGFVDPFGRVFPDGIKGQLRFKQRTIGFENQLNYKIFEGNELTFGFQYEWIHQGDIHYGTNFNPLTFAPLPTFTDFSDTIPFTRRATRQIWALYLQDEWNITKDIDLTVGVRYDNFTRFGGTTNPRFGLIWRFMENAHLKLLFATAFRAPNFQELFLINNPQRVGDPNLDPEKINTYEVGLGYDFTKHIRGNINYFFNRIRDRIILDTTPPIPDEFKNKGGARILGVEAEVKADFGKDNYAYANYTFQKATDTERNRLPDTPIHKANFGVNMGLTKYANANLHTFLSGPRPRDDGDTRRDLPAYALVNLTVIGKNFMDNFEIRGSVHNLFDKGYEDPSPNNTVPTDYPQPGRAFMVELRYKF